MRDFPPSEQFDLREHPDYPGWTHWRLRAKGLYNDSLGLLLAHHDSDRGVTILRSFPARAQANLAWAVHGGAMLTQIDIALFAAAHYHHLLQYGPGVTLDIETRFLAAGTLDQPLDTEVELLRETGRLAFLRGLMVQGETIICSFSGAIRKTPKPPLLNDNFEQYS